MNSKSFKTGCGFIALFLMSISARAGVPGLPSNNIIADFSTGEEVAEKEYVVNYPNQLVEVIRNGMIQAQEPRKRHGDCMALVHGYDESTPADILKFAKELQVSSGSFGDAQMEVMEAEMIHGTVVFTLPNIPLYVTRIAVRTRDGKSFSENRLRVLGADKGKSMVLTYVRNCTEVVN